MLNKGWFNNLNSRYFLIAIMGLFILIITVSGVVLVYQPSLLHQSQNSSSLSVSITSVSVESITTNINGIVPKIEYSLRINANINFPSKITINSPGLNACSFGVSLGSSNWFFMPQTWMCPAGLPKTYSGSYDFFIPKEIVSNSPSVAYPTSLNISLFSMPQINLNITSKPFMVRINSQDYKSLTITNASLNQVTLSNGSTTDYINTTFYLISDQSFNVTTTCGGIFQQLLVGNSGWNFVHSPISCLVIYSKILPSGTTKYSISSQLENSQGQLYNYTTPLPSNFQLQVTLGNNVIKSNVYTFVT